VNLVYVFWPTGCSTLPPDCELVTSVVSVADIRLWHLVDRNTTIDVDYTDWMRHGFDPTEETSVRAWQACAFTSDSSTTAFHVFLTLRRKPALNTSEIDDEGWFVYNGMPMRWDLPAPGIDTGALPCLRSHWNGTAPETDASACTPPQRRQLPVATSGG
jgi:hypothetical protein